MIFRCSVQGSAAAWECLDVSQDQLEELAKELRLVISA